MKILLFGKNGQLGWELQQLLWPLGEIMAFDYPEVDFSQELEVRRCVRQVHPQVIVNAAAYTAVDRAEQEVDLAHTINASAPGWLAEEANALGATLVHYSTDYVYDGAKDIAYVETDTPNPLGIYGQTKLAGDQAIQQVARSFVILRTSWVYSLRTDNFVTKVLHWAHTKEKLRMAVDQVGSPTAARFLAGTTALLLARAGEQPVSYLTERAGMYHLAGDGQASRLDWAQAILRYDPQPEMQTVREVQPGVAADFPTPARRPMRSALNCGRFASTFGLHLPPWEETLRMILQENVTGIVNES